MNTSASAMIAPLFDLECVIEEGVPALVDDELFPEEREHLIRAVPKRRAEFGTARVCARRALQRLNIPAQPLVPDADRAPRWPQGIIGSITHTGGYCGVVVARAQHARSLGLDVEQDKNLASNMLRMICTKHELTVLGDRAERDAIVYFSAKEAFYKCQHPLTKTYLDFRDVELDVNFETGTFQARVLKQFPEKPPALDALTGRFIRERGLVASGLVWPSD